MESRSPLYGKKQQEVGDVGTRKVTSVCWDTCYIELSARPQDTIRLICLCIIKATGYKDNRWKLCLLAEPWGPLGLAPQTTLEPCPFQRSACLSFWAAESTSGVWEGCRASCICYKAVRSQWSTAITPPVLTHTVCRPQSSPGLKTRCQRNLVGGGFGGRKRAWPNR